MDIKAIYVTFEQAKLLKEKGFDIWVQKHYDGYVPNELRCSNGFKMPRCSPQTPEFDYMSLDQVYYAPEQWQVVEWLRVEKGIYVTAQLNHRKKFYWCLDSVGDTSDDYKTPQEAYSSAFNYILNNLI